MNLAYVEFSLVCIICVMKGSWILNLSSKTNEKHSQHNMLTLQDVLVHVSKNAPRCMPRRQENLLSEQKPYFIGNDEVKSYSIPFPLAHARDVIGVQFA